MLAYPKMAAIPLRHQSPTWSTIALLGGLLTLVVDMAVSKKCFVMKKSFVSRRSQGGEIVGFAIPIMVIGFAVMVSGAVVMGITMMCVGACVGFGLK